MGPFSGVLELLIFKIFCSLRHNRDTKLNLNPQRGLFNVKMLPPPPDSGVHQLISISTNRNRHKPGKSTTSIMFLYLLRVQENNILPQWYEETTGLCFDCPEDGDLHIPSQPTCSHFYLWVKVPGYILLRIC